MCIPRLVLARTVVVVCCCVASMQAQPDPPLRARALYFGGAGDDRPAAIAVDRLGNAYVIGSTSSADFPAPVPLPPSRLGERPTAVYLLKLDPAGTASYAVPLTEAAAFGAAGIAVGADGAAYVLTAAPNTAHVIKVDPAGARRVYDASFGGIGRDAVRPVAIGVDAAGHAVVLGAIGFTSDSDIFLAKLDAAGRTMYRKVLPGGSRGAAPRGLALDQAGNVYVTGQTGSDDFPTTQGTLQTRFSGGTCVSAVPRGTPRTFACPDAFLVKLTREGDLVYSTYFGGTATDEGIAVAVDRTGAAVIAGITASADLPTLDALQPTCRAGFTAGQCGDGFVAKVSPTGARLVFATFLGGSVDEQIAGVAVDPAGSVYVAGSISGNDLPLQRAVQPSNGGGPAFFSADAGRTWALGVGLQAMTVREFAWIGGGQRHAYAATDRGVFVSVDGGASWRGQQGVPGRDVRSVAADPRTTGIVYAGVYSQGVFKSVDGGTSWVAMSAGLGQTSSGLGVQAIAVAPSEPSTLYIGTDRGMFKSDDGAMTWRSVRGSLSASEIAVHPTDAGTVYVAGSGTRVVTKTVDGGITWRGTGPLPAFVRAGVQPPPPDHISLDPFSPSVLYAGYFGGVSRSLDGGASWHPFADGLPAFGSYDVATDVGRPGTQYAIGRFGSRSLYRSTGGSGRWELVDPRFEGTLLANADRILLGGTAGADTFVVSRSIGAAACSGPLTSATRRRNERLAWRSGSCSRDSAAWTTGDGSST